ncbi:maleylpyruvate isomerase family mycothiol-dependent enzyme [Streptomyces sp. H27-C3]|uniref:maleylpyruvate isomerase family mycothiol-dependent enzyme n=1 Tax=Streptomyces sp. H27-C3 TaxID=3046305 RepID=UPI0024BAF6A4|nr:maleylpyruvate isomerase family mycothiol-dependent enzyme [Streptomyces sp. H27-C3]MDJ0464007.1 maleylpyruvate isomerase family mycothiol-dependent enzyme [Streptomyces sp. H27-C3]
MSDDSRWASTPPAYRDAVPAETARLVALVQGVDLATPVPSCPGWTLLDLVRHTGSVQRWFSVLLRQRVQEPPRSREVELRLPAHEDGYADWLTASSAEATAAFAETDPDAPMWAWGADQHARFWIRRMLFETLVHRVDVQLALGQRPVIDPGLAVDGIDEFLVNLPFAASFAPWTAHLRGDDETIRFRCTDRDGGWLVRLRPDDFVVERLTEADEGAGAGKDAVVDATVEGASADLLLLLYGRFGRTSDAFKISGDDDLLLRWFANSAF